MLKWILVVCAGLIALSLVISFKAQKAVSTAVLPVPVQRGAVAVASVEAVALDVVPAPSSGKLTKAEETLTGRVVPKYDAPSSNVVLPQ
ncbi:MAG: hypothetical protein V2A70_08665 [Candidatus Omnitrophota bacterium]